MPATEQYWRKLSIMHKVFAASSIALLAATIFMMVRDQQRDWRYYQTEAIRLREERFSRTAEDIRTVEFTQRLGELEDNVEVAEEALADKQSEIDELKDSIDDLDGRIELAARKVKFQLAEVGKARADYDLAVRDERPAGEQQELLDIFETHEEHAQRLTFELQDLEAELAEKQLALRTLTADYDAAQEALDKHREELSRIEEVLDTLHPSWTRSIKEWPIINAFNPNLKIEYDWPGREMLNAVQRIPIQLGMARVDRVDRCRTCHFNINEYAAGNVPMYPAGAEDEEGYQQPFASHPHPELFLTSGSPHPIEEFGCTICHEGDGSGTGFQSAEHTPTDPAMAREWEEKYGWHSNHFWEYPMHPGSFVESSCIRCHHSVVELGNHPEFGATAPTAYEGYELISRFGCFGCHEINGHDPNGRIGPDLRLEPQTEEEALAIAADPNQTAGTMRKVGPSLRHIASKVTPEFIAYWTREPTAFRPTTRMPQFFDQFDHLDLEDHHDELAAQLQPVELAGIAAYLTEKSEPMEFHSPQEGYTPDAARGEVEFRRCLACHQYNNETYGEFHPDFGPDLSNIHEKMLPGEEGFRWLYNWIRDPESYHPRTRMPYQFLEPAGEGAEHVDTAADIAAFLLQGAPREFPAIELPGPTLGLVVAEHEQGLVVTEVLQGMAATRAMDAESRDPERPITLLVDDVIRSIDGSAATAARWTELNASLALGQEVTIEYARGRSNSTVILTANDPLHDLAGLFLGKALDADPAERVMVERRMLIDPAAYLTDENGNLPDVRNFIRGDEIELVHESADGSFTEEEWNDRLLIYVGRRTISRYGCYGCHDIPGFETSRPIGTALQDWGRKDTSKLALEHIEEFLHHHHEEGGVTMTEQVHEIIRGGYFDRNVDQDQLTQAYFYESLMHHGRPGFIWQKLRDPRSYDFAKLETKGWDERLRMPNFHFDEHQIEAISTFVLGLVADPPPEPYLYRPDEAERVRIEGERLLEKYNCTSCHMLEMPGFEYMVDLYDDPYWTVGLTRDQIEHWLTANADALQNLEHVQDVIMERAESSDGTMITDEVIAAVTSGLDWSVPGLPGTPEEQQAHVLEHMQPFVSNGEFLFGEILDDVDVKYEYLSYLASLAGGGSGSGLSDWFDENPQALIVSEINSGGSPSPEHPASFPLLFDLKPATTFGEIGADGQATVAVRGLVNGFPDPELPEDEREYSFDLWQTLEVGGRYRLPGARAIVPLQKIVDEVSHRGGDYALWLSSHLLETNSPVAQGQLSMAWQASPPPLYLEGIKVQTPWLYEFLKNPVQLRYTPVLRMPRFNMSDEEAQILANYFAAVAGAPFPYQSVPQRRPEYRETRQEQFAALFPDSEETYQTRAWQLLNADVCSKCHAVGGHAYQKPDEPPAPGTPPPVQGPNLDRVASRLQPDWLQLWLYNPKVITSYTSMPINFPHNQTSKPELFGGNPTIQTQAARDGLMDYLHLLEQHGVIAYVDPYAAPPAEGTAPAEPDTEGTPSEEEGGDDNPDTTTSSSGGD
jgi:cytochrome c2